MAFVTNEGVEIFYQETGSGHPLLFLHEFAGDARAWELQVRFFSRRYRCIVMAARGYPPSQVPEQETAYGWEQNLADAIAVLDHLLIKKTHVIGLSMGAYIGLLMSIRHMDRVSALVAASGGSGAHPPTREAFIAETLAAADRTLKSGVFAADEMASSPSRIQLKHKDPKGWAEFRDHLAEHPAMGCAYTYRRVQAARPGMHDFADQLAASMVPTFLMVGDEDDACLDVNLWLKRTMPMAGLSVMPKAGHLINLEEPARFNELCADFFSTVENRRWKTRDAGPTNATP